MKRRVVITGMGAVTPLGCGLDKSWAGVRAGSCGIGPITQYDTAGQKVTLAGEARDFDPAAVIDPKELRRIDRFSQLAVAAAAEALGDSGIAMESEDPYRCCVLVSSGIGGLSVIENEHSRGLQKGFDRVSPFFIPMCISNMAAAHVAIKIGAKGMCSCPVTACAGGSNAIGDAFRQIRDGYADVIFCGGAESCITPLGIGGFTSMKAVSEATDPARASIPFDKERSGFVMGEGAGVMVLEEHDRAISRGAKIYAEVIGYGATCDAYHITAPEISGAIECMSRAVADAGITPTSIDYINAHGTSTPINDRTETQAIKTVFGDHAKKLMISSTKSMTGHMLGASGAVEALFTAMALKEGFVPPTVNYKVPDEECDLDIVPNIGREIKIRYALSNSLGFGGHNATLALKRWEEE